MKHIYNEEDLEFKFLKPLGTSQLMFWEVNLVWSLITNQVGQ